MKHAIDIELAAFARELCPNGALHISYPSHNEVHVTLNGVSEVLTFSEMPQLTPPTLKNAVRQWFKSQ